LAKPSYSPKPAPAFYAPTIADEDLLIEEIMNKVLVRYGKDPIRLRRVLTKLYALYPVAFQRAVNGRVGRVVLL
jgi:hypothetical protein